MPPNISTFNPISFIVFRSRETIGDLAFWARSLQNKNVGNARAPEVHRFVNSCFERDDVSSSPTTIGCYDDLTLSVIRTLFKRLRAETTENDAVRGPDSGAREHRERQFGNHWHIDAHAITLTDSKRL